MDYRKMKVFFNLIYIMLTAIESATYVRHKQIVIDKDNKLRYLTTNYAGLTTQ